MNSNLESYISTVHEANSLALKSGTISMSDSLPCLVCRELEVPVSQFVDGSDPLLMSFRALRRNQGIARPIIPRKIEFGSAVYLKEGIIDCIFPNSPVTLLFIGDGTSDKRFAYNTHRLFKTFGLPFRSHCFIYNPDLVGTTFGRNTVELGWDKEDLFYHAQSWNELQVFIDLITQQYTNNRIIMIVDIDGTLLCPRPAQNWYARAARKTAISRLCDKIFHDSLFSARSSEHVTKLETSYEIASNTGFSMSYDDEDLTMLIALGLYAGIISDNDILLNPQHDLGFVTPIEWLQYATFLIENDQSSEYHLRQLRALYVRCADALQSGSPTAFVDFRKEEEKALVEGAETKKTVLNRKIIEFISESAKLGVVPVGFSDRPNACFGLETTSSPSHTAAAVGGSLFHSQLQIT